MIRKFKYWWDVLSIYIPMNEIAKISAATILVITALAIAFKFYFILIFVLFWFGFVWHFICTKWTFVIKPIHEEVNRDIDLEEKYDFMFDRFTKK